ncbi:MAG: hypothetical protein KC489_14500, partial [Gemmatimonadetes bacterium]|nr:hypothetical protein [Gemmatimonadota bacterium]
MIMVIGTTFVTPPWLAWLSRRGGATDDRPRGGHRGRRIEDLTSGERATAEDIGTVDDLVSGAR